MIATNKSSDGITSIQPDAFVRRLDLESYFGAIKQHSVVGIIEDGSYSDKLYRPATIRYLAGLGFYPMCYDAIHKKLVIVVKRGLKIQIDEYEPENDEDFCQQFAFNITYLESNFFATFMPPAFAHIKDNSNIEIKLLTPEVFKELLEYVINPLKIKDYEKCKRNADTKDSGIVSEIDETVAGEWLDRVLTYAVIHRASDVHFEWTGEKYVARIRIDGDLQLYPTNEDPIEIPPAYYAPLINVIRLRGEMDITEHFVPQDGQMEFTCQFVEEGKVSSSYDLRISIIPEVDGRLNAVLRIQQKGEFKRLNQLGFSHSVELDVGSLCKEPHGLILVTGPTGSGKTTTLYSMLSRLNTPNVKILTAEDPVEIKMPNITQVSINERQRRTFPSLLRSFLRHDPDIILVGEIRDPETAKIAINAANTGHLVLSTLHTNDAPSTIKRLGNMEGIEPSEFAFALKGILAQRLIKIYNSDIRKGLNDPTTYEETIRNWELQITDCGLILNDVFNQKIFGSGCFYSFDNPDKEGVFEGRTAITEFWKLGREAQDMIFEQKFSTQMLWRCAIGSDHMLPMAITGFEKVIKYQTSFTNLVHVVGLDAIRSCKELILKDFFEEGV